MMSKLGLAGLAGLSWSPSRRAQATEYKVPPSPHPIYPSTLPDCSKTALRSNAARHQILTALAFNKQAQLWPPTTTTGYLYTPPITGSLSRETVCKHYYSAHQLHTVTALHQGVSPSLVTHHQPLSRVAAFRCGPLTPDQLTKSHSFPCSISSQPIFICTEQSQNQDRIKLQHYHTNLECVQLNALIVRSSSHEPASSRQCL